MAGKGHFSLESKSSEIVAMATKRTFRQILVDSAPGVLVALVGLPVALSGPVLNWWQAHWQSRAERKHVPHGKIEVKLDHVALQKDGPRVLRARVEVTNTGVPVLPVYGVVTEVRQVLPLQPCSEDLDMRLPDDPSKPDCVTIEIGRSMTQMDRCTDYFRWPLLTLRWANVEGPPHRIEPNETVSFDTEYAVPREVKSVLVYSQVLLTAQELEKADRQYKAIRTGGDGVPRTIDDPSKCNEPKVAANRIGEAQGQEDAALTSTDPGPKAYRRWMSYHF